MQQLVLIKREDGVHSKIIFFELWYVKTDSSDGTITTLQQWYAKTGLTVDELVDLYRKSGYRDV